MGDETACGHQAVHAALSESTAELLAFLHDEHHVPQTDEDLRKTRVRNNNNNDKNTDISVYWSNSGSPLYES